MSQIYPANLGRGYFATFLLDDGLSERDKRGRQDWLKHLSKFPKLFSFIEDNIDRPYFQDAFMGSVANHGIFYEKFFDHFVGPDVISVCESDLIDQRRLSNYMAKFWGRSVSDLNADGSHVQAKLRLRELYIMRLLDDSQALRKLKDWFSVASEIRRCIICEERFAPANLPPSTYFGSNGQIDICFNCPVVGRPVKKELKDLVPAFVSSCGFIPSANASPVRYHFMSRQMKSSVGKVLMSYARMGGINHVKKKFGTWFEALAKTGTLPEGTLVTSRGIKCMASDGHVCHSLDEQRIDDWLSANKIAHAKEPSYPRHPILNPKGLKRGDWLVGEHYLEYFGLVGDERYDKKVEEKLLLCAKLGLKILAIYPKDIANLDQKLRPILRA